MGFEIVGKEMNVAIDVATFIKQSRTEDLRARFYARKYQGLAVEIDFGQVSDTRIPWMSFLYKGQKRVMESIRYIFCLKSMIS